MAMGPGNPGIVYTPDGKKMQVGEGHKQPTFDEVVQAAGTIAADTELEFMLGSAANAVKKLLSTNIGTQKKVRGGIALKIDRVGVEVLSTYGNTLTRGDDFRKIIDNYALDFRVNTIEIAQGPAEYFPSGFGIYGQTQEAAASILTNGMPNEAAQLGLESPVWVNEKYDLNYKLIASARPYDASATRPVTTNRAYERGGLFGFQFAGAVIGEA